MDVRVHSCVGGTAVREDIRTLQDGVQVVVGTPGRVCGSWLCYEHQRPWDHLCREYFLAERHPATYSEKWAVYQRAQNKRRK